MDVDWVAEIVDQVEAHWDGRLRPRLEGLTDDEYFWEPVAGCWSIRRAEESPEAFGVGEFRWEYGSVKPEPVTTIAWRLGHLIVVLGSGGHEDFAYAGTADEALRQLDAAHDSWIASVQALGIAGLSEPQGSPPAFAHAPVARKVMYTSVEIFHHGAEIALLRDLYLRS